MSIIDLPSRAVISSGNTWATIASGPCTVSGLQAACPGGDNAQIQARATLDGTTAMLMAGGSPDSTLTAKSQTRIRMNPVMLDTGDVLQVTSDEAVHWIAQIEGESEA